MLVDIYRAIRIALKFIFYDFWAGMINILFRKQNERIRESYNQRVKTKRKRL